MKGTVHKFQLLNCLSGKGDLTFPYFKHLKSTFNNNGGEFNYWLILRLEYEGHFNSSLCEPSAFELKIFLNSQDPNSKVIFIGCLFVKVIPYGCTLPKNIRTKPCKKEDEKPDLFFYLFNVCIYTKYFPGVHCMQNLFRVLKAAT